MKPPFIMEPIASSRFLCQLERKRREKKRQANTPPNSNLERLPPELRHMIWNELGKIDDFQSLLQTSRYTRADILFRIPGSGLWCKCKCNKFNPCTCGPGVEIESLKIIVDSDCAFGSWLKFSVAGKHGRYGPVWSVRHVDSNLALALRYCHPRNITIEFHAPKKGYYLASFHVLLAKIPNICTILNSIQMQSRRTVHMRFCDPWAGTGAGPSRPFWENRMSMLMPMKRRLRSSVLSFFEPDQRKHFERREWSPYFYEAIMVCFKFHPTWRFAQVMFDRDPKRTSSSFTTSHEINGQTKISYYWGHEAFTIASWGYSEQLHDQHIIRVVEKGTHEFEDYDDFRERWHKSSAHHESWRNSYKSCLSFILATMDHLHMYLKVAPESHTRKLRRQLQRGQRAVLPRRFISRERLNGWDHHRIATMDLDGGSYMPRTQTVGGIQTQYLAWGRAPVEPDKYREQNIWAWAFAVRSRHDYTWRSKMYGFLWSRSDRYWALVAGQPPAAGGPLHSWDTITLGVLF